MRENIYYDREGRSDIMAINRLKQILTTLQQTKYNLQNINFSPILNKNFLVDVKAQLDEIILHVQEPIWIMVMGEFSTGKSTFINAMVGQKVAVMDATPTTAVITKLCYGEEDRTTVYFRDGNSRIYSDEEFAKITAKTEDGAMHDVHAKIDYVERQMPLDILKWVTIIDSPGLNDIRKEHVEATQRFVKQADTVFWLYSAEQAGSKHEFEAMENLSSRLKPIAIVNKMDMYDEEEEEVTEDEFLENLRRQLGDRVEAVIGVSAKYALEGKLEGNAMKEELGNFVELDRVVREVVMPNRETYKMNSLMDELGTCCFVVFQELSQEKEEIRRFEKDDYTAYAQKRAEFMPLEETFSSMAVALKNISEPYAIEKNAQAMFLLATFKYLGIGAFEDKKGAIQLLEDAAVKNNKYAQIWLANIYWDKQEWKQALHWFMQLAEQGESQAQEIVGIAYYEGKIVEQDYSVAVKWFTKLADGGDSTGQFMLALCYMDGKGVPRDKKKAVELYTKAAEQGDSTAQRELAFAYLLGMGTEPNDEKVFYWAKQAADQGDAKAQALLGACYQEGRGTEVNEQEGFRCYKLAAEAGIIDGQKNLAVCYLFGSGTEQDTAQGFAWLQKAVDQGDALAKYWLGECYGEGIGTEENKEKAFDYYTEAANNGIAGAQRELGYMYILGIATERDPHQGVYWLQEAAMQGDPKSQCFLGICYEQGIGVGEDASRAFSWYEKAMQADDAEATKLLGDCYYHGRGTMHNEWMATQCYHKAANMGFVSAQYKLAQCYETGCGIKQDIDMAGAWALKAAEAGCGEALLWMALHTEGSEQIEWLTRAAEADCAEAQYYLGLRLRDGNGIDSDWERAADWFEKAANNGMRRAWQELAMAYREGKGRARNQEIAFTMFEEMAKDDDIFAQYMLSNMYWNGEGVQADRKEALRLVRSLADKGFSRAQVELGDFYFYGVELEEDHQRAFSWYRKAAEQGELRGYYGLGECYYYGRGTQQSYQSALEWYEKADKPNDGNFLFKMSVCLARTGDKARSAEYLKRAAEMGDKEASTKLNDQRACRLGSVLGMLFGLVMIFCSLFVGRSISVGGVALGIIIVVISLGFNKEYS